MESSSGRAMISKGSRMTGEERKESIVKAAREIFAQKGFDATSMKDIAKAAGVSTALLYIYFPSKENLHEAIHEHASDVVLEIKREMQAVGPGTEALAILVSSLVYCIMFDRPKGTTEQKTFEKLLFRSLIGNTSFAEKHFRATGAVMNDKFFMECLEAALQAGDLETIPAKPDEIFWFVHHLAMALNLCHLSGHSAFPYSSTKWQLYERAVSFCLRGIGLKEQAFQQYIQAETLLGYVTRTLA